MLKPFYSDDFATILLSDCLSIIPTAADKYLTLWNGIPTEESWEKAWSYIPKIAAVEKRELTEPGFKKRRYIVGILRNRFRLTYQDQSNLDTIIKDAQRLGMHVGEIESIAKKIHDPVAFCESICDWINEMRKMNNSANIPEAANA